MPFFVFLHLSHFLSRSLRFLSLDPLNISSTCCSTIFFGGDRCFLLVIYAVALNVFSSSSPLFYSVCESSTKSWFFVWICLSATYISTFPQSTCGAEGHFPVFGLITGEHDDLCITPHSTNIRKNMHSLLWVRFGCAIHVYCNLWISFRWNHLIAKISRTCQCNRRQYIDEKVIGCNVFRSIRFIITSVHC